MENLFALTIIFIVIDIFLFIMLFQLAKMVKNLASCLPIIRKELTDHQCRIEIIERDMKK